LALQGRRVGLLDTDFQGASAQLFFGPPDDETIHTFNDFLWKKCDILDAVQDLTSRLGAATNGKLFLVSSSTNISDIIRMLRTNMSLERYTKGLATLGKTLNLDILLVDTPAGLNENTLMSLVASNELVLVLHPDQQDFQGTAVIVDVVRKMPVGPIHLVLNDSSETLDDAAVSQQLEQTYQCGKATILGHSEELLALGSAHPFVLQYPDHPLTARIKELALRL
jgi:MinD-like ATPase involved in chromosome partitioning or flagellar assembly